MFSEQYRSFLGQLCLFAVLVIGFESANADDLVYSFRGVLPPGACSHSGVSDGETFTAIFTIDPAVADSNALPDIGQYFNAVVSGKLVFSGGYVSSLNFENYDIIVFDQFTAGVDIDGVQITGGGNRFQASTVEMDVLFSDDLPLGDVEFDSGGGPDSTFFQLNYADAGGSIVYNGTMASNVRFVSKDAIAFSNVNGASPFYCLSNSWLAGIDGGPPSTTDTALFGLYSTYDVIWSDICASNNTVEDLCVTYGNVTFDNVDGGNYMLTVNDDAEIDGPARLNLGDGTLGTIDLDIDGFLIVDGQLDATPGTSILTSVADLGRESYGRVTIDGPGTLLETGPAAMYIGVSDLGDLNITGGAVATDGGSPVIGAFENGNGLVAVSDPGSRWDVTGNISIGAALGTFGFLEIDDNAEVLAGGDINVGTAGDFEFNYISVDNGYLSSGGDILIGGTGGASLSALANSINVEIFAAGQMEIAVSGTVDAVGDSFPVDFFATQIVNAGEIVLGGTHGCDINPIVFNTGTIHTLTNSFFFSDVVHDGIEIRTQAGGRTRIYGVASGAGNYAGTGLVSFSSEIKPGAGSGAGTTAAISFAGDVQMSGFAGVNGVLNIELGENEFDRLIIAGDLTIASNETLLVAKLGDFVPCDGDEYLIIKVDGNVTGTFDGLSEGDLVGSFGGVDLTISYRGGDGNDIVLTASGGPFLLGDVNLDCEVNLLDVQPFIDLLATGEYQAEADINGDGFVNLLDVAPFVALLSGA